MSGFLFGGPLGPYFELFSIFVLMRNLLLILVVCNLVILTSCIKSNINQITDSVVEHSIFIGHPRSNDVLNQSMIPAVERIDYSKFSMTLLGGDLTQNSSSNEALVYLDSIFDLSNPNTLFALGNHDYSNPLLQNFTGRDSYYAYFRNGITYLVLNTEYDAGNITNNQLELLQYVTDTISQSSHLIIIHHRILWMIGNDNLDFLLPFVGGSTSGISATNFYTHVYPLLVNVEDHGIDVICIGGDRTNINIEYVTSDSVQFIATGMQPNEPDSVNYVVIFEHNLSNGGLTWFFHPLSEVEKISNAL